MKNAMVAYFSASGVTAKVARRLAKAIDADLFEIRPETPYTKADLNGMDKKSRSTLEMNDPSCRPAMAQVPDVSAYDVIFVGFPIWWYREPSIIDSFMESADFTGKTVVPLSRNTVLKGSQLFRSAHPAEAALAIRRRICRRLPEAQLLRKAGGSVLLHSPEN